jgi:hypothetical protein
MENSGIADGYSRWRLCRSPSTASLNCSGLSETRKRVRLSMWPAAIRRMSVKQVGASLKSAHFSGGSLARREVAATLGKMIKIRRALSERDTGETLVDTVLS